MSIPHSIPATTHRRDFLKHSGAALAYGALASEALPRAANLTQAGAMGDATIRVALVGCGGRGTGAAVQALSTNGAVELVAVADAFSDRLEDSLRSIREQVPQRVKVDDAHKFVGFDAYQKAIDCDIDLVILTTPPGFRPMHFAYAVEKGRHVFMEKPVAVDAPGVRSVLASAEIAKTKNLKVGVGLQRHHDPRYKATIEQLHAGAIGALRLLRVYWNSGGVWVIPRGEQQSEMEYQMRNWYYFNWLCGDHIVEQHIHNIDVANWIMQGYPVSAQGQGGRQVRTGKEYGEIFDHHFVEFTYADGTKALSQCRHIPNCHESVSEHAHGASGVAEVSNGRILGADGREWRYRGDPVDPYQVEHDVLFDALRKDLPHNEAENGAKSTMSAILGRMATYSGRLVTWEEGLNSPLALVPDSYTWEANPPTMPDEDGYYPIPMPGNTRAL